MNEIQSYKTVTYLNKVFVYCILDGSLYLESKEFFKNIFDDRLGYSKNEKVKKDCECKYTFKKSEKRSFNFYLVEDIELSLCEYRLPISKYKEDPSKYKPYIDFVEAGAFEGLCKCIAEEELPETGFAAHLSCQFDVSDLIAMEKKEEEENMLVENLRQHLHSVTEALQAEKERGVERVELYESAIEEKKKEVSELQEQVVSYMDQADEYESKLEKYLERVNFLSDFKIQFHNLEEKHEHIDKLCSDQEKEIEKLEKELEQREKERNEDKLGDFLQRNMVKTLLTIFVILTFLPFTVGALMRYIPFEPIGSFQIACFWILCIGIALVWDSSILYFAKTGQRLMSRIGSIYQFLFFCAEFDLISSVVGDMTGYNGDYWQKLLITFCIVSFSAVLVNQFTELSIKKDQQC